MVKQSSAHRFVTQARYSKQSGAVEGECHWPVIDVGDLHVFAETDRRQDFAGLEAPFDHFTRDDDSALAAHITLSDYAVRNLPAGGNRASIQNDRRTKHIFQIDLVDMPARTRTLHADNVCHRFSPSQLFLPFSYDPFHTEAGDYDTTIPYGNHRKVPISPVEGPAARFAQKKHQFVSIRAGFCL